MRLTGSEPPSADGTTEGWETDTVLANESVVSDEVRAIVACVCLQIN